MLKGLLWTLAVIVFFSIIGFALNTAGFISYKFWAPKKEAVRREVFENTKSYNESKKQDLLKYRMEYIQADDDSKEAIASVIRMMFADFDESKLEPELAEFLREMKY